jgi:predicted transcriptional regulator
MTPRKKKVKAADALIAVGVRLSRETKTAMDVIAKDEGRSFSNLVQRALDEWLRQKGKPSK